MGRSQRDSFERFRTPNAPYLNIGSDSFGLSDGRSIERSFVDAGRRLRSELLRLNDLLERRAVTVQGYVVGAKAAVRTAFFHAYSLGAISVFPFYTMTDRDVRILNEELTEETGFLRSFARDIAGDRLRLDPVSRSGLYLLALRGIFERGRVEAMPPGPYRWQLGITEHCSECLNTAVRGPYQRDQYSGFGLPTLPGSPGDGSVCLGLTRCGCRIGLANGTPVPNQELAERLRGRLLEIAYGSRTTAEGP